MSTTMHGTHHILTTRRNVVLLLRLLLQGNIVGEREFAHSGEGLAALGGTSRLISLNDPRLAQCEIR
jgi:hypothetical protein